MKRPIPTWYLIMNMSLIAFSFISNGIISFTQSPNVLAILNFTNLTITISLILIHTYLATGFIYLKYEVKAVIIATFYAAINIANIMNFLYRFYENPQGLWYFSLGLKAVELSFLIPLLVRNLRK